MAPYCVGVSTNPTQNAALTKKESRTLIKLILEYIPISHSESKKPRRDKERKTTTIHNTLCPTPTHI